MQRLSGELAHASRVTALGQLATGLAHEINQPLATIVNYAGTCELLLEQELPGNAKSRQAVMEMKQAASRAGAIVLRMRNFVRPGPGQAAAEELNDLTREVLELCRPELLRADVELSLELPAAATPVFVDALQIQQVLVNLIQNAIQAMRDGAAPQRRLRLRTSIDGDEVQLERGRYRARFRLRDGAGSVRSVLYHPAGRAGNGTGHQPRDHRAAPGTHLGRTAFRSRRHRLLPAAALPHCEEVP